MEDYILDTSAISAYLHSGHSDHATAVAVIDALPTASAKLVSIVTLGELEFGLRLAEAANSAHLAQFRERIAKVRLYTPLNITHHTAYYYADIKSKLALLVKPKANKLKPSRWVEDWIDENTAKQLKIDENDLWIVAQAKERDLTIVTGDRDMESVRAADPMIRLKLTCS